MAESGAGDGTTTASATFPPIWEVAQPLPPVDITVSQFKPVESCDVGEATLTGNAMCLPISALAPRSREALTTLLPFDWMAACVAGERTTEVSVTPLKVSEVV